MAGGDRTRVSISASQILALFAGISREGVTMVGRPRPPGWTTGRHAVLVPVVHPGHPRRGRAADSDLTGWLGPASTARSSRAVVATAAASLLAVLFLARSSAPGRWSVRRVLPGGRARQREADEGGLRVGLRHQDGGSPVAGADIRHPGPGPQPVGHAVQGGQPGPQSGWRCTRAGRSARTRRTPRRRARASRGQPRSGTLAVTRGSAFSVPSASWNAPGAYTAPPGWSARTPARG